MVATVVTRPLRWVAVAVALALPGAACDDGADTPSATTSYSAVPSPSPAEIPALPPPPSPAASPAPSPQPAAYGPVDVQLDRPGVHTGTIDGPDGSRTFHVHLPEGELAGAPLLLALHGYTQDAAGFEEYTGLAGAATQRGIVAVTADGIGNSWNGGLSCCPPATRRDVDDVGFLDALAGALTDELALDPDRTWVVGFSNGGFLGLRVACEGDGTVDAVVSHAGTMDRECAPTHPVSVLLSHGDRDPVIPFEHGRGPVSPQAEGRGARAIFAAWRALVGCPEPTPRGSVAGEELLAAPCQADTAVGLVVWRGVGHSWPHELNALVLDWLDADGERRDA